MSVNIVKPVLPRAFVCMLAAPFLAACASAPGSAVTRPMPRGVVLQAFTQTYPVAGSTEQDILRSLRESSAREGGFVGHYRGQWRWSYRYVEGGARAGCRLDGIRIDFQSTIRIPEWRQPSDAPADLVTSWKTYVAALDDHEREHERIALQMAGDLVQRLERMRDLSCRQLGQDAQREARAMSRQMQERQSKFDADTRHGAATGVRWPVRP